MRVHSKLTQCLIAAALLAAVFSPAARGQHRRQAAPPAGTAGGSAVVQPAAADRPVVAIIRDKRNPAYNAIAPRIDDVMKKYGRRAEFHLLDVQARDPLAGLQNHPLRGDIQTFFDNYQIKPGTAKIFVPGRGTSLVELQTTDGVPSATLYLSDFNARMDEALGSVAPEPNPNQNANQDANQNQPTPTPTPTPTPDRRSDRERLDELGGHVRALDGDVRTLGERVDNFQPSGGWLGYVLLTLLGLLGLGAGLLGFTMARQTQHDLAQTRDKLNLWSERVDKLKGEFVKVRDEGPRRPEVPLKNPADDGRGGPDAQGLQEQIRIHVNNVSAEFQMLRERLTHSEEENVNLRRSLVEIASWLGGVQTRGAGPDGGPAGEAERDAASGRLEAYAVRLRSLAERVRPLTSAVADLSQTPAVAVSSGLSARVQKLYADIRRFESAERALSEKLQSLRNGSYDARRARFAYARDELMRQLEHIPPADFIKEYRELYEEYFPEMPGDGAGQSFSADEVGQLVDGAEDYLMDWFSGYTQLLNQAQAAGASAPQITPRVLDDLARVHAVAREVLRGLDILPVEIQLGQTAYDHRLHDAAMIKATTEYPANTVIEVQSAGFRRMSTGDVLRRPQVIVSGATTAA